MCTRVTQNTETCKKYICTSSGWKMKTRRKQLGPHRGSVTPVHKSEWADVDFDTGHNRLQSTTPLATPLAESNAAPLCAENGLHRPIFSCRPVHTHTLRYIITHTHAPAMSSSWNITGSQATWIPKYIWILYLFYKGHCHFVLALGLV